MREITIKSNGLGRYDDVSSFLVTDNKLELKINLPNFSGEFFFVYQNGGKTVTKLLTREGNIVLENLEAGELLANVKHYLRGELVKTYKIEPLVLKEAEIELSATPEITYLADAIKALCVKTEETEKRLMQENKMLSEAYNNAIKVINDLSERVYALEKNYDPTLIK